MRVGIYSPYLETLGGGEKYALDIADMLQNKARVDVFWDDKEILSLAEKKFGFHLVNVRTTSNIFDPSISLLKKISKMRKYDLIFFFSDGSIPVLTAKKNILVLQFPVNWAKTKSLVNQLKLFNIHSILCYSFFVKKHLEKLFNKKIYVLPPAVSPIDSIGVEKENIILTVGRFTRGMNTKKQGLLVDIFKNMVDSGLKGWKFVAVGSYLPDDLAFVEDLIEGSVNYPIEIKANASYKELQSMYKKSKIYWHGAGFGEDLERHPELAEHFGITTVEAMSAGCIPLVFRGGGQKEIVGDGINGYAWETEGELIEKTQKVINDEVLINEIVEKSKKRSIDFAPGKFRKKLQEIIL